MNRTDKLLWLAGLEMDCPGIEIGDGEYSGCTAPAPPADCPGCKGTGKVPKFPMLRKFAVEHRFCPRYEECSLPPILVVHYGDCGSRGYVIEDNLAAALDAAESIDYSHTDIDHDEGGGYLIDIINWTGTGDYVSGFEGRGTTRNEAAIDALYQAVGGQ